MAGGTFWQSAQNVPYINMLASGYFLILSSLLANATSNATYLDAANRSFQFMYNHIFDQDIGLPNDGIGADSCVVDTSVTMADTGLFLEGVATLAAVTRNSTLQSLASDVAQTAIATKGWQTPQGILYYNNQSAGGLGHGKLVRALGTVYELSDNETLRDTIRSFIAVQYNALVDLASDADGNYAGFWAGPPLPYDFHNESSASDLLLAGLAISNNASQSSSHSPAPSSPPASSRSHVPIGAVVGGIVGGVIILLLLLGIFILDRKRKTKRRSQLESSPAVVEPWQPATRSSANPFSSSGGQATSWQSESDKEKPPEGTPGPSSHITRASRTLSSSSRITGNTSHQGDNPDQERVGIQRAPSQRSRARRASGSGNLTIGELVRQLNDRLRRGEVAWNEDESPPMYGGREGSEIGTR